MSKKPCDLPRTKIWACNVTVFTGLMLISCNRNELVNSPSDLTAKQSSDEEAASIFQRMLAAYRECESYADNAVFHERIVFRSDGVVREPPPQSLSVLFERPASLRLVRRRTREDDTTADELTVTSNGSRIYHTSQRFPQQVLESVAPIELTAEDFAAPSVRESLLALPLEDVLPQLDLLISANPQQQVLAESRAPKMLGKGKVGERLCHQVVISSNAGQRVYWIDEKTYALRRLDLATGTAKQQMDPQNEQIQTLTRWIEFSDAVLNPDPPDEAFEVEIPKDAVVVRKWVPGHPGPPPTGSDATPEAKIVYEAQLKQYQTALAAAATSDEAIELQIEPVSIAARSEPQHVDLEPMWSVDDVTRPGNLLVSPVDSKFRLLALDLPNAVVEIAPDGEVLGRRELESESELPLRKILTASDSSGSRFYATIRGDGQSIDLHDEAWKHQWSFPGEENPGIGDACFVPMGDNGEMQLAVGFWGDWGVHGVSMVGKRSWVARSLQQVLAVAAKATDDTSVEVCTAHGREVIGRVGKGQELQPLIVPGRAIVDLAIMPGGDSSDAVVCTVAFVESGIYDAVGLDGNGRARWSYRLPKGEFTAAVTRLVPVRSPQFTGWIIPAADGSVHLVDVEGQLRDRFNTGAPIHGIAATAFEGNIVLIIASDHDVEAWTLNMSDD